MNTTQRTLLSIGCFAVLLCAAFAFAWHGAYGWTLFVVLPLLAGGMATWSLRPLSAARAVLDGAATGTIGCALFLLLGAEGWICVLMALPVVVPLAMAGSLLTYWSTAMSQRKKPAVMVLLLPISLFFDVNAKPPVYSVVTSIVVNAPPERVWKNIVAFPDITDQPDWVLRTGLAYPIRTRIEGVGAGVPRNCDLSTGTVKERVVIWDEPRLLRFVVTSTPCDERNGTVRADLPEAS